MTDILFIGQFIATKAGATGLTVTVDVDRYTISDGSRSSLVTAGSATEGRRGLYSYRLTSADLATYQYVATFITSDATVDQQHVAAIGLVVPDALVSSRSTLGGTAQTGDAYARLTGTVEPAIADVPTVAEFEARTLAAASYFDPAADVVAHVTLVDTVTTLTNMPAAAPTAAANADAVWDELLSGHVIAGSTGAALTAAGAAAGGTLYSYSNTVDDGSGNLLDGVFIQLSSTSNFADIIATAYTNAIGAFTVRSDTAGTHYLRLQLAGYNFTDQTVTLA